jgi:cytochrome c biogenesis protein CcmG/thiol:disulfide interchange protein DsbE
MKRPLFWVPLIVFAGIVILAAMALTRPSDGTIRSQLIDRPLPQFALHPAFPDRPTAASAPAQAGPRILNIFASWCVPCIAEAPQLLALARRGVPIDAIAIRDRPQDIAAFLQRWGDPYRGIGLDNDSRVQFALGSSGVPETFVIDGRGVIRFQHIGPLNDGDVETVLRAYEAAR